MTARELAAVKLKLPLSASTLRRNASVEDRRAPSRAEPKPLVQVQSLGQTQGTPFYTGRVSVRIESYRMRLVDSDRLCGTYFTDCLRYAGIILGDEPDKLDYAIRQEKVASKSLERTEIVVTPL